MIKDPTDPEVVRGLPVAAVGALDVAAEAIQLLDVERPDVLEVFDRTASRASAKNEPFLEAARALGIEITTELEAVLVVLRLAGLRYLEADPQWDDGLFDWVLSGGSDGAADEYL